MAYRIKWKIRETHHRIILKVSARGDMESCHCSLSSVKLGFQINHKKGWGVTGECVSWSIKSTYPTEAQWSIGAIWEILTTAFVNFISVVWKLAWVFTSPGKLVRTDISGPYIRYVGHSVQSGDQVIVMQWEHSLQFWNPHHCALIDKTEYSEYSRIPCELFS